MIDMSDAEGAPFPLTDIQRAYLVGREEGALGGVSTHAYFEFEGEVDPDRLRHALNRVVARHGTLRTVIDPVAGTQRVLTDPGTVPVELLDLRNLLPEERATVLAEVRERMSHAARSPDQWPLFGVTLSRLHGNRIRVHMDFDGLLFDLTSWGVVLEDLAVHYRDPEAAPPAPSLSYRACLGALDDGPTPELSAAYDYWRGRELPPAPRIPLVCDLTAVGSPHFTDREHRVPPEVWARLRRTAASHGIMPAGLCAGAFVEVLARRCRQTRFTLTVPCTRRHGDHEGVVGQFAGFLPVEVDWAAATFAERVRLLQRQIWADLRYREGAGPALTRRLVERYATPGTPLFPVVFTSGLGHPFSSEPLPGCHQVYTVSQTPQVYFDAQVVESGSELVVNWDTVDAVVGADTVDAMFDDHARFLERLGDPGEWTSPSPVEGDTLALHTHRVLPRDPVERVLLDAWETALGVAGLGVTDDLPSLGAGPAAALRVADELQLWLPGSGVDRHDLLAATTVAGLAVVVAARHPDGSLRTVAELSLEAASLDRRAVEAALETPTFPKPNRQAPRP